MHLKIIYYILNSGFVSSCRCYCYTVSQLVIVEMSCIVLFDQGLKEPHESNHTEQQIYALATRWRAGLLRYRQSEFTCSEVNDLGLRIVSKNYSGPQLTEMCLPSAR